MQNQQHNGVICDRCGQESAIDFTYYSVECKELAGNQTWTLGASRAAPATGTLDLCTGCEAEFKQLIIKHHYALRGRVCCDLTGQLIAGTYYYLEFTKVSVAGAGTKAASTNQLPLYVELNVSAAAYAELARRVQEQKQLREGNQWSTSSA